MRLSCKFSHSLTGCACLTDLAAKALFFDNENGFVEVADYRNGTLRITTDNTPDWLSALSSMLR